MIYKFNNIFDKIHAEDELIQNTKNKITKKLYQYSNKKSSQILFNKKLLLSSFLSIFIIGFFIFYNSFFTPVSYVDLDVNPSIEISINRFGKVISIKDYNDDANYIAQDQSLKYLDYNSAIKNIIKLMLDKNYIRDNSLISLTVQSKSNNSEVELLNSLNDYLPEVLGNYSSNSEINLFSVSKDIKQQSNTYNISPAKYMAICELQKVDPDVTFEGCSHHSISELKEFTSTSSHGSSHGNYNNNGHHGYMKNNKN